MCSSIGVIIPTSKSLDQLDRTLSSLADSSYQSFETLIIQNGVQPDPSRDKARLDRFAGLNLRIIHEAIPGLLAGRHRGVRESDAEILVFIDDDVDVSPHWAQSIADNFRDERVQMVGGPSIPEYGCTPPAWLDCFFCREDGNTSCSYLSLITCGEERTAINPHSIWGLNFSIRRSALEALGGFHPDGVPWKLRRFRGDGETAISQAALDQQLKAIYEPAAAVTHVVPCRRLTVEYFQRRAFLQGISASYTDLRGQHLGGITPVPLPTPSLRDRLGILTKQLVGRSKHATELVAAQVQASYRKGYQYHQTHFARDQQVRQWVLRQDYWDYSYPADS